MPDEATKRRVDTVVRSLATATKTLRLYPASSPIPRQTADAAVEALAELFVTERVLPLAIAREGFSFAGTQVSAPGSTDLADVLTRHGVAEVDFVPGASAGDLLTFLTIVLRDPEVVREGGGIGAALASEGIEAVRVSDVALTVVETALPTPDGDVDEFLRELASDPDKLALWLAKAADGDPTALAEGLAELESVVGAAGLETLIESLSSAFMQQQPNGRDALLGLATKADDVRDLMASMFGKLGTADIADSLAGGLYGKNMLSMSNMLASLPLGGRVSQVLADVGPLLAGAGHSARELAFLEHMLETRERTAPEAPLTEQRPDYTKVAAIAEVRPDELARARTEVQKSMAHMNARSIETMLQLLDQQEDFELYCKTLTGLASTMPSLFETREVALAGRVLTELTAREARTDQAWPELAKHLQDAVAQSTGTRSMSALLHAVADDPALATDARDVMRRTGASGQAAFVREAIAMREIDGLALAEEIIGRRLIDLLVAESRSVQWFAVGPIVKRLAAEGDARCMQTIDALIRRPDEQSRQEVAKALGTVGTQPALRQLVTLMRDPSTEVALVAIRAAGRSPAAGAAAELANRFGELDCDGKDFSLCKEILQALGRSSDPAARTALQHIASRKALIKRGHFAEVASLARQALTAIEGGER